MIRASKVEQVLVTYTLPERAGITGSGREREVTMSVADARTTMYALAECLGYVTTPKAGTA